MAKNKKPEPQPPKNARPRVAKKIRAGGVKGSRPLKSGPKTHPAKNNKPGAPGANDNPQGKPGTKAPAAAKGFNSTFVRFPDKITDEATGRTVLIDAILKDDKAAIGRLLEAGASPNKTTKDGKSPLHYAVRLGLFDAVNQLLEAGAQVNPRDKKLATPLFEALQCSAPLNMLDLLLEAGASADIPDAEGRVPLHLAAEKSEVPVIRALVAATENPNRPDDKGTQPLHAACEKNTVDAVQALLFERVDVFSARRNGDSALHIAAARDDSTAVADFLLTTEAARLVNAVNLDGKSPLHIAVAHRRETLTGSLIAAGANVNVADSTGRTPLHEAAEANHPGILRLLIGSGADVARLPNHPRTTPLIIAIRAGAREVADLLLRNAADPSAADADGVTPLMAAAGRPSGPKGLADGFVTTLLGAGADAQARDKAGRNVLQHCTAEIPKETVTLLVDAGADINNRDNMKRTPVIAALVGSNMPLFQALLDKGADTNARDEQGYSALQVALDYRKLDFVGPLLDKGADPNSRDRWQDQTALHLACRLGLASEIEKLVKAGAKLDAKDREGRTPLHVAVQNSYHIADVVRVLLENGADPLLKDNAGHSAYDMAASLDKTHATETIRRHLQSKGVDAKPNRYNPYGYPGGFGGRFA